MVLRGNGSLRHIGRGTHGRGTHIVPHQNLLVSLANAMGVPIDRFGHPDHCTGPLSGLT